MPRIVKKIRRQVERFKVRLGNARVLRRAFESAANQKHCGRFENGNVFELAEIRPEHALVRCRSAGNNYARSFGGQGRAEQFLAHSTEIVARHVDCKRRVFVDQRGDISARKELAFICVVAAGQQNARTFSAVR